MSAWIVSKAHIDALVQAMVVDGVITLAEADETGQQLWSENHHSIDVRYREANEVPTYKFEGVEAPLWDPAILALIHCWDYQTCEFGGYDEQPGYGKCLLLAGKIFDRNGIPHGDDDPLWQQADAWGIDDILEATEAGARRREARA